MRLYFEETLLVQVVKLSLLTLAISQCLPPTALGISPEEFVACEMEAFEREKDQFLKETHLESTRSKRTIKFNGRAPIDLGMLFGFPLTLTLPSLSNYFQFNKDKKKRSIPTEVESEDVYEENPFLQPQVDRISAYFHLINIPETKCRERAICEFAADPTKFFPVSDLILNRLRHASSLPSYTETNAQKEETKNRTSLFERYNTAADWGTINGLLGCEQRFSTSCPYPTEKRLKMDVLAFWNFLSNTLHFTLKDDLEFH